jgi:energy-coupling factor transport system permease protein
MRPRPLVYRRIASPLHVTRAGVAALWGASLTTAALLVYHPLVLAMLLGTVLLAARGAGVGAAVTRSMRLGAIVCVPIVLVNVIVSRQGLTVFARLGDLGPFGAGNLTVEALVYGCVIALKVMLLILITTLASLAIDPDELLRMLRRLSFRSALTASLATRMVPVLAADAERLAEAQRTRPRPAAGLRARTAIVRAVVAGSLDRAMDVAATLEVRGFATARRARRIARPWSRHDLAFAASAAALLALAALARIGGAAAFDAYPRLSATLDPATLLVCLALPAAALFPLADRRGIEP